MSPSKEYFAAAGGENLSLPQEIIFGLRAFWGCVKSLLPPSAAEYYFERHVILTISRSEIVKMTCLSKHKGLCKKFLPPAAAEFSLDGDLFLMISRSEIIKTSLHPNIIWREAP